MTDTTSPPVADPGPPPARPATVPVENRFFAWVRGLGVVRAQGWLGGVSSGLAARMGIDPVIVRGLFVVAALIGFPALLVYAIGWALLPDTEGRIPAQQLGRGLFEPSMIAIGIMALLGIVPTIPWLWSAIFWPLSGGAWGAFGFSGLGQVLNTLLTIALVGGIIALVIWLAVRASQNSRGGTVPDPRTASADPAAPGSSSHPGAPVPTGAPATEGDPADEEREAALVPPPAAGAPPESGTQPADEVADWRARQDEWRTQRDAWRRQESERDAAAREQARLEREAAGRAFALEADARRRARQATNPRASAVFVLAVLGAGLVAGALAALTAAGSGPAIAAAAGILVAALMCAVGMIVAGALRRRSGFLAFSTIVLLVTGLVVGGIAGAAGPLREGQTAAGAFLIGRADVSNSTDQSQRYLQPSGYTLISVLPVSDATLRGEPIVLRKGSGYTEISVNPGVTLELDARLGGGTADFVRVNGKGDVVEDGPIPAASAVGGAHTFHFTITSVDPDPNAGPLITVPVRIDQNSGDIRVTVQER